MTGLPRIARGALLAYRVYDAGDMIALDRAEECLVKARRLDLRQPLAAGLVVADRPIEVELGTCVFEVPGVDRSLSAKVSARIFDFGAMSILFEVPIAPGTDLASLIPLCDALYDAEKLSELGARHRDALSEKLGPCITKTHGWRESESFTILFAEELDGTTVGELRSSELVARLLLGERGGVALSADAKDDVLKNAFSYLADDLVIVDWNSALVVEPSGSRIVPHVLELATSQLLEFRYYDGVIGSELARVYEEIGKKPHMLRNPFGARTRDSLRRYMELTEFTERVDNAIKSVGDFYLARVYLAAQRRFRVPEWRESVVSKLDLVGRAYELLKGEVEVSRTQILEITVVVLILLELLAAVRGH